MPPRPKQRNTHSRSSRDPDFLVTPMPELPEVEAVARTLRPLVQGERICCLHVFHPIAVKPQSAHRLAALATDRLVERVERKGKYLLLMLDRGLLTLHFKLDGQLVWFADENELFRRANANEKAVHVDVAFELTKGVLGFADRRHFGRVCAWNAPEESPGLASLGVDALSKDSTVATFSSLLAACATVERFLTRSNPRRGAGKHLLLRIAVARAARSATAREIVEAAGSDAAPQSNCVGSCACLRMLPTPGAGLSRFAMVVSRTGEDSARLWPPRRTLPPMRSRNSAYRAGRPVHVLVPALPEIIDTRNIRTKVCL